MKKYSLLLGFLFMLSCQKNINDDFKINDTINTSHNAKNSLDYIGVYKGTLPCADCEGLETKISINENATFTVATKYLGKGEKVFIKKGTFSWNKEGNTIEFNEEKNGLSKYFVGENSLTQLDMSGKKITGDLASEYILTKQTKSNQEIESNEGIHATVDLNNRMEVTTTVEKVNPAIGKFTLAETKWKLTVLYGKAIEQKAQKNFSLKLNSKDGKFKAYAGCNTLAGNYFMKSTFSLSFSDITSTMIVSHDIKLELRFSKMLSRVDSYAIKDNLLQLKDEKKVTLSIFEAIK
jgi:heat shock protein HslJ